LVKERWDDRIAATAMAIAMIAAFMLIDRRHQAGCSARATASAAC
jgi:hypothetical protein